MKKTICDNCNQEIINNYFVCIRHNSPDDDIPHEIIDICKKCFDNKGVQKR